MTPIILSSFVCLFVLFRGFRDLKELLEYLAIEHDMPAFKPKGVKQLTTEQGNESRLTTKERGAVERYHGTFKRIWPFFQDTIPFSFIPYIGPCLRVVTAVLNKYRIPIVQYSAEEEREALSMLAKCEQKRNKLADKVFADKSKIGPKNKVNWTRIDALPLDDGFPKLTLMDVRKITCGPYQIKKPETMLRSTWIRTETSSIRCVKLKTGC